MEESQAVNAVAVLFVDDEENILRAMNRLFVEEQFSVYTASSGDQGLGILEDKRDIGVIVSDNRMPGMTGIEFLEKAKRVRPHTLRILLTGYSDINSIKDAINLGGAYRYVTKPWNDDELVQIVREAVHNYSLVLENMRLTAIVKAQNAELKEWNNQLESKVREQTSEITRQNEDLKVLYEKEKKNFRSIIGSLSGLIELRDKQVRSHSRNVAEIAAGVARTMKLPQADIDNIIVASLLHDIGKIGVPDAILAKSENRMTPDELDEYKLHCVRGQAAVDTIQDLQDAGLLIRHHHEWFNGSGFPDGLKGDAIPLGSQIIAIADYVDRAIPRIKDSNAEEIILNAVKKNMGSRFNSNLYAHFVRPIGIFFERIKPVGNIVEKELHPGSLKQGMILARDFKSGTGVLLMPRGTRLDEKSIETLHRYHHLDPSKNGIFVYVRKV